MTNRHVLLDSKFDMRAHGLQTMVEALFAASWRRFCLQIQGVAAMDRCHKNAPKAEIVLQKSARGQHLR